MNILGTRYCDAYPCTKKAVRGSTYCSDHLKQYRGMDADELAAIREEERISRQLYGVPVKKRRRTKRRHVKKEKKRD